MPKQVHNAFYFFMLDFKDQHGKKFKSLKEVADAAGPHWRNLSKDQRYVYEERARSEKSALKVSKLNSDKKPVDEIEYKERKELEFQQQMKDEIQATITFAKRSNTLESHMFFIIHMNSFCLHEHSKTYSPCEVAIAGFSLRDGVLSHNVYHAMIKPGRLPLGYAGMAQQHANETHQIELPTITTDAEDNQEEIFTEIIEFLSSKKRDNFEKFPVLYAANKHLPMVRRVFKTWCANYDQKIELFQIYNLECMFRILRNAVAGLDCWQSDTMSYQEIEKDVYNYTPNIACEFHQIADALVFCSRSIAVRYAFIICDNCCKDANIPLIPGQHVPSNSLIKAYTPSKSARSKKSALSKHTRMSDSSIREDSTDTETVISIGRSSVWEDTSSSASINFPELGKSTIGGSSQGAVGSLEESSNPMSQSGSYAGAATLKTGSSGFSKKPAAPPFNITERLSGMTISQNSMDAHFPKIGAGRARSAVGLVSGKGRGHPFKKPTS